jgi:uncharacterized protein (DUF2132 family)
MRLFCTLYGRYNDSYYFQLSLTTTLHARLGADMTNTNDDTSNKTNYKTNPLHGLSLKNMLIELVNHYGFETLFAYLNINCFKTNPSIESSVKFLKKTDWAREKVESFYLYQLKSLPRASNEQFELSPRDRVIPEGQVPGEPAELDLEDAARLQEKRARKAANHDRNRSSKSPKRSDRPANRKPDTGHNSSSSSDDDDPWAKWR